MFSALDTQMMQTALELAKLGRFSTSPNPRVGCVIAHGAQIIGQGFHVKAGEPHAEVHALRQAGAAAKAQQPMSRWNLAAITAVHHRAPKRWFIPA
ncbi:hypothetical protein [Neisseria sp. HMSC072C05]|uniref:hypothetical protein n=1 Tax=Neisseria sp. HMSC072C05 TaxID=1715112 RepID=UPI000A53FC75